MKQVKILSLILSLLIGFATAFNPSSNLQTAGALTSTSLSAADMATTVQEVKVGDKIPDVVLKEGQADYGKPVDVNLLELIS